MYGAQLLMDTYMPELEQLKLRMATREKEGVPLQPPMAGMTENTTQLVTSNLTELSNWGAAFPLDAMKQTVSHLIACWLILPWLILPCFNVLW